jgi:hypothetical protein
MLLRLPDDPEHFRPDCPTDHGIQHLSLRGAQRRGNPTPEEQSVVRQGIAASLRSSQ